MFPIGLDDGKQPKTSSPFRAGQVVKRPLVEHDVWKIIKLLESLKYSGFQQRPLAETAATNNLASLINGGGAAKLVSDKLHSIGTLMRASGKSK